MRKVSIVIWETDKEDLAIPQRQRWNNYIGTFHQWGINYEELSDGIGNYTVAIVELEGGRVVEVIPTRVQFLDPPSTTN